MNQQLYVEITHDLLDRWSIHLSGERMKATLNKFTCCYLDNPEAKAITKHPAREPGLKPIKSVCKFNTKVYKPDVPQAVHRSPRSTNNSCVLKLAYSFTTCFIVWGYSKAVCCGCADWGNYDQNGQSYLQSDKCKICSWISSFPKVYPGAHFFLFLHSHVLLCAAEA